MEFNYMSADKSVTDKTIKVMAKNNWYKELNYVIRFNRWPIEKVEQIVGETGTDIMVRCVVESKKEKKFDILEHALSARPVNEQSIQARLELLPYASKEFKEETKNLVMEQGDLVSRYNYAIKTKDKSCAMQVAEEAINSSYNEFHLIRQLCTRIPGEHVKKCEDWLLKNCSSAEWLEFMLLVPDCDKKRLNKEIDNKDYVEYTLAHYSHEFEFKYIYDSLVKLGNKDYVKAFFDGHPEKNIEELEKFAKTAKQKEFYEKIADGASLQR